MDADPAMSISEALLEAYTLIWEMYDDALESVPEEHWRTGEIDYLIPARQVYHAVETADFYSGASPNDFPWGRGSTVDVSTLRPRSCPPRSRPGSITTRSG